MRKPPSDHDEWIEENRETEKPPIPPKKPVPRPTPSRPRGADVRFKALNDDIQEFG